MKKRTSRQGGFTLVEIMIVVAIIGLLASIAIPNFVKARTTAQMNACISNLRQIDGAIQQWALDTKQGDTATVTRRGHPAVFEERGGLPVGRQDVRRQLLGYDRAGQANVPEGADHAQAGGNAAVTVRFVDSTRPGSNPRPFLFLGGGGAKPGGCSLRCGVAEHWHSACFTPQTRSQQAIRERTPY